MPEAPCLWRRSQKEGMVGDGGEGRKGFITSSGGQTGRGWEGKKRRGAGIPCVLTNGLLETWNLGLLVKCMGTKKHFGV